MTWYERAWSHMSNVRSDAEPGTNICKAIDDSYPWGKRSGWPYKAWLRARRAYCRKFNIPLRRAKKPGADLFS